MMNALIMAHGRGSRYMPSQGVMPGIRHISEYKQMIPVGTRGIIQRTYDQLKSRGVEEIHVIAPEIFKEVFPDEVVHNFPMKYDGPLLDGMYKTSHLWHVHGTLIILGDVLFSYYAIDWLTTGHETKFLGRLTPNELTGKTASELFALRIYPPDYETVKEFCRWMADPENVTRAKPRLWSLLKMMSANHVEGHDSLYIDSKYVVSINDYTDDVDSRIEYGNFFEKMRQCALQEDEVFNG